MNAFEFNYVSQGRHKEDIWTIIKYLKERGTLNISENMIDQLYCDFSYQKHSTSWAVLYEDRLEEFAEWLSEYDVRFVLC